MRYTLFTIFFFLGCQLILAQDRFDGSYKDYYDSGELFVEGQYKDDKRVGEWKQYYKNGQVSRIYSYTDGELNEEEISYYDTGVVSSKVVKVGELYIRYGYYESGKLKYERKEDSGYYKGFYEDGQLQVEANYIDRDLSGKWKQYYKNGVLEWIVTYQDGYRHGAYQQFYENGKLKVEGVMLKEKKEGAEMRYNENEELEWKGYYEADEFAKTWVRYNENGKKVEKIKVKKNPSAMRLNKTEVPDGVILKVPVYPGCETVFGNKARIKCMNTGVAKFIAKTFNTELSSELGLSKGKKRIFVAFKIDETGHVKDVNARGPHPALEKEAKRVINVLPTIRPGKQNGKPVTMPFSIPIVFAVK